MMTSSNGQWHTRSFDVFFDLCLDKRLNKQSKRRWFKTPSRSLWRHCNVCTSYYFLTASFSGLHPIVFHIFGKYFALIEFICFFHMLLNFILKEVFHLSEYTHGCIVYVWYYFWQCQATEYEAHDFMYKAVINDFPTTIIVPFNSLIVTWWFHMVPNKQMSETSETRD